MAAVAVQVFAQEGPPVPLSEDWDNLWERRGGSMVNGAPREVPESTQCTH